MADKIIANVIPNMKAIDLGDGTHAYAVVGEDALDRGVFEAGSAITGQDTEKDWPVNHWAGDMVEVVIGGVEYHRLIASNTADTLTFATIAPAIVIAGNPYVIRQIPGGWVLIPLNKAIVQNTAELAGVDILAAALVPTAPPCMFKVYAGFDAAGVFSATITSGGNTQVQLFNGGVALNVNSLYAFTLLVTRETR